MALPQNPQGITNSDRLLLEAVNTQNDSLRTQTKVLHTVSDNIIKQNKEFVKMRKDIGEFKNAVVSSSDMLDAFKKYFGKNAQDNKSKSRAESNVNKDKDAPSKGFFKDIFGKVFGPSKYQQKLIDDTASLLRFTEVMANDMSFIRKKYEDSARAKERELLATAIAQKMGGGGGGGIFGSVLSGIGAVLTTVFTGGMMLLGSTINGLGNIISGGLIGLGTAIGGIAKGLGNVIAAGLGAATLLLNRMLSVLASIASVFGIKSVLPDVIPPVGRSPGAPTPKPGLPGPNKNVPQLPGRPNPNVEDAPIKREGPRGTTNPKGASPGGFKIPGSLGGLVSGLSIGAIAYELFGTSQEEAEGALRDRQRDPNSFENRANAGALKQQAKEERKQKRQALKNDDVREGRTASGRLRDASGRIIPRTSGMPSTGLLSESGDLMYRDSEGKMYPNLEMANQADMTTKIGQSLNKMVDGILGLETEMENAISKGADKIGEFVDRQMEIDFGNGNKLNLMPNLGQSTVEVLKEMTQETKDLLSPIADSMKGSMTNIINNVSEMSAGPAINFSSMVSSTENWATDTIQKYMFNTPIR